METSFFPQVVGHEALRRHLGTSLVSGAVSHAYLCVGPEGVGRHSLVMAFVQALLCESPKADGSACGICTSCRTVANGNHPDVRLLRVPADKKAIPVDMIKDELVRDIAIMPYKSEHKIYIVENAETMSTQVQNALLKTIEEPPAYGHIFFIGTGTENLLPTVLSRCVTLKFEPLADDLVRDELVRRGLGAEKAALGVAFGGGCIGRALKLSQDEEYAAFRKELFDRLKNVGRMSDWELMELASWLEPKKNSEKAKKRLPDALSLMQSYFRDALIYRTTGDETRIFQTDYTKDIKALAQNYNEAKLAHILRVTEDCAAKLAGNANAGLCLDVLMLTLSK